MKRTAAVIVTYNRKAMLQRCLRALCTQTAGVPELWVIDNASTVARRLLRRKPCRGYYEIQG